jgi:hypothetical protein
LLPTDIQEKTPKEAKRYYLVFKKKQKHLAGTSPWIIYSVKRGEPERILGSHIGLPIMW